MAKIKLHREHNLSLNVLKDRVDALSGKLKNKLKLRAEWESESRLVCQAKGVKGSIEFNDKNIDIELKLGIMYRALKKQIEAELESALDKYLE